jgi:carboxyvinyl-carboxyphosphonate phosphorylmutase
MVDADHGYGNALNVMRTIQELETAGVAGIMIEDTVLPRAFGEKKPSLISIDEGIGKMRAALSAREDKALTIIGRTGAAAITDWHDALARAKAYEKEGVDAMFFAGGVTKEFLEALHAELKIPIMMGGGAGDFDKAWLGSVGVRIALQGHQPFSAAVQAVYNTLKALRDGTKPSALTGIASSDMMAKVTRAGDYRSWTEKFLT